MVDRGSSCGCIRRPASLCHEGHGARSEHKSSCRARLMPNNIRTNGGASRYYLDQGVDEVRAACGRRAPEVGLIPCLKCSEKFKSPDRVRVRICDPCKESTNWKGTQESDHLYPGMSKIAEFTKKSGRRQRPGMLTDKGRAFHQKKGRTGGQKSFDNGPKSGCR